MVCGPQLGRVCHGSAVASARGFAPPSSQACDRENSTWKTTWKILWLVETMGLEPTTPCLQSDVEGTGTNCAEPNPQVSEGSGTEVDPSERT